MHDTVSAVFLPMASIVRLTLESAVTDTRRWAVIAARTAAWADENRIALRDAIVLLLFAQLLPDARAAFAQRHGWMPRIETTRTLAASLGPAAAPRVGELSFDPTLDAVSASALLRSLAWGRPGRAATRAVSSRPCTTLCSLRKRCCRPAPRWRRVRARRIGRRRASCSHR